MKKLISALLISTLALASIPFTFAEEVSNSNSSNMDNIFAQVDESTDDNKDVSSSTNLDHSQ